MVIDIIQKLKEEVARIRQEAEERAEPLRNAIEALEDEAPAPAVRLVGGDKRGRGLTPEGRQRLSLAMKQRWADRKIGPHRKAS